MARRHEFEELDRETVEQSAPAVAPAAADLPSLVRSPDAGARRGAVLTLQRGAGNAAVGRLLRKQAEGKAEAAAEGGENEDDHEEDEDTSGDETIEEDILHEDFDVEVKVRDERDPAAAAATQGGGPAQAADAPRGSERHPDELAPEEGGALAAAAVPRSAEPAQAPHAESQEDEGEEFSLPDMSIPNPERLASSDAIRAAISYRGEIAGGLDPEDNFGLTNWGDVELKNLRVRRRRGAFRVRGRYEHRIKWGVQAANGPGGELPIRSYRDRNINADNYTNVADALTPDESDLSGRPPRDGYWAPDITKRHEKYHARDAKGRGPGALRVGLTWLRGETAADDTEIAAKVGEVPTRMINALIASMGGDEAEHRAYADGVNSYKRRVRAIHRRGDAGRYPEP